MAWPLSASSHDLQWLAVLGLVQLAIPCVLAVICARVLQAPEVSLLALLEVIFGIALAWWGANEVPQPQVLQGGVLVLLALATNEWLGWKQRQRKEEEHPR
jgi:drug/metabolite transporter (DMT)-like permease